MISFTRFHWNIRGLFGFFGWILVRSSTIPAFWLLHRWALWQQSILLLHVQSLWKKRVSWTHEQEIWKLYHVSRCVVENSKMTCWFLLQCKWQSALLPHYYTWTDCWQNAKIMFHQQTLNCGHSKTSIHKCPVKTMQPHPGKTIYGTTIL